MMKDYVVIWSKDVKAENERHAIRVARRDLTDEDATVVEGSSGGLPQYRRMNADWLDSNAPNPDPVWLPSMPTLVLVAGMLVALVVALW